MAESSGSEELGGLRADLADEQDALEALVAPLDARGWATPTASPGWDVTDQIGHLTYFDGTAALAVVDPDAFAAGLEALFAAAVGPGTDAFTLGDFRSVDTAARLAAWRENRRRLAEAAATLVPGDRVPWYGPSMGARSFLSARLMEVWAHGTDVADALGTHLAASDRLRHIAQLGFLTRRWSYTVRGEPAPTGDVYLELTAPSGERWDWGALDAPESVRGSAEDFCGVVTQRRHLDDTGLSATAGARHWLLRAQAFAGGPTDGPPPGGR